MVGVAWKLFDATYEELHLEWERWADDSGGQIFNAQFDRLTFHRSGADQPIIIRILIAIEESMPMPPSSHLAVRRSLSCTRTEKRTETELNFLVKKCVFARFGECVFLWASGFPAGHVRRRNRVPNGWLSGREFHFIRRSGSSFGRQRWLPSLVPGLIAQPAPPTAGLGRRQATSRSSRTARFG